MTKQNVQLLCLILNTFVLDALIHLSSFVNMGLNGVGDLLSLAMKCTISKSKRSCDNPAHDSVQTSSGVMTQVFFVAFVDTRGGEEWRRKK